VTAHVPLVPPARYDEGRYRLVRNVPMERYHFGIARHFEPTYDCEEIDDLGMPVRLLFTGGAEQCRMAIARAERRR
jgi:hypothetical protein